MTLFDCKITILRLANVPVADFNDLSCDPYIQASLSIDTPQPQVLTYRTHTCRRSLNPHFNAHWIVAGIPQSGFLLSLRLRDEDPGNYDDDLGKTVVRFPQLNDAAGNELNEGWDSGDREYKVHKRKGSVMSQIFTWTARAVTKGDVGHRVRIWVSVKVLQKSQNQQDTRLYTIGPLKYVRHFSPLIGKFLGSSNSPDASTNASNVKPSAFIANRIQLAGPIPPTLRHRYVGFAPFVKAMFRRKGLKGIILHHMLHKQHMEVYKWDKNVVWGLVGDNAGPEKESAEGGNGQEVLKGDVGLARQFLRMTSHGTHGRIFTYVIMLDGEWRFTETGHQFAIEFLSKHTMHSDVEVEIAYSGEFFVRPLRHHHPTSHHSNDTDGPSSSSSEEQEFDDDDPPDDPAQYELVIDNDSGTYRPRADLLPTLHAYLASPHNLGGGGKSALGRVTCMDGFDERLQRWKEERKQAKGKGAKVVQASLGSGSSSVSVSVGSELDGGGGEGKIKVGVVEDVLEEDAKRARENDDQDGEAKGEERRVDEEGGKSKDG
ncbi:hypothetical protein PHLCEN_2v10854 [Hermanssonia centrifuga]|uniref:C2 domain-containing protein n=1 Tax=Hermanssonia centrifuga TaxID=98765 RepID=A0A2R6NLP0_9APHY|nr:hypothetical protein PHLCEN_2v10854 [Hermanssonia centrifuga]